MKEKAPDLIGAALLVALGAAFAVGALTGLEVVNEKGRIGSGFMPFATGLLLVLFGAMVGVEALLRGRGDVEEVVESDVAEPEDEEGSRYKTGIVFALTLAAVLLVSVVGFLVSFGLLVFALVKFVERESLLLAIVMGVGAAIFTWAVFVLFLQIPLPGGLLGIGR